MSTSDGQKKILVIDNHRKGPTREENALAAAGYLITTASPGRNKIQVSLAPPPDLILFSFTYGDPLDAYVFKRIVERREISAKPIIVLSTNADVVRKLYWNVSSVVEVLGRPCPEAVLMAAVEQALRHFTGPPVKEGYVSLLEKEVLRLTGREGHGEGTGGSLEDKIHRMLEVRLGDAICEGFYEIDGSAHVPTAVALVQKLLDPGSLGRLSREIEGLIHDRRPQGFRVSGRYLGLSDVLQSLSTNRRTGMLIVGSAGNQMEINLHEGLVCFLNPRRIQLRHYQETICMDAFSFPTAYIEEALKKAESSDDSLLFHIIEDGKIAPGQLLDLMVSLGIEVLQECMSDQEASSFEFRPLEKPARRFLECDAKIPVQRILMMLSTRLDEWNGVPGDAAGPHLRFIAEPGSKTAGPLETSDDEAILDAVQRGPHTIAELSYLTRLSPILVWRSLDRLRKDGVVRTVEDGADRVR